MSGSSPALWSPAFRNLFVARVVSVFGDGLVPVALAIGVLEQTGSPSALGLVVAANAVAMVVFVLAGGVWADRLPRRTLMAAADVARFLAQLGTAIVLITEGPIAVIAALQFAVGAATAVSNPASSGLLAEITPVGSLQRANGVLATTASAGEVAGPAVAGVIVVLAGAGYALALDALTFLVSAACLMRIPAGAVGSLGESARTFVAELREGWRELVGRTWLWVSVLDAAVFSLFALSAFVVIAPAIATEQLGGAGAWALITAALAAGSVAGGLASLARPARRPLAVGYTLSLGYCVMLVAIALELPLALIAVAAALAGAGLAYSEILYEAAVQEHVPGRVIARVSAWDWLGSTMTRPIGFAAVGPIAAATGASTTLAIAAGVTAAATCAALLVPDVRNLTHADR